MTSSSDGQKREEATAAGRKLSPATAVTLRWHRLDAAPRSAPPVQLGKYQLLRHLADGENAHLFLARLEGVGGFVRHLVVKMLRRSYEQDPVKVACFLDEARFLAALQHRNIVPVLDVGITESGIRYFAMEHIHGETLHEVLRIARERSTYLPMAFALTVAVACADALEHVHRRYGNQGRELGLSHRELTLPNVMVAYDGGVTLLDFGSAKTSSWPATSQAGRVGVAKRYVSPEQAAGQPADCRSDVYAVGLLLYELTTLTPPIGNGAPGDIVPPTRIVPGYSPALAQVVMTALARNPAQRYQDCSQLGRALFEVAIATGHVIGPRAIAQVLAQWFGARPEPWNSLAEESLPSTASQARNSVNLADGSRPPRRLARATPAAPAQGQVYRDPSPHLTALEAAPTRPLPRARRERADERCLTPVALMSAREISHLFDEARAAVWPENQLSNTTIRRVLPSLPPPQETLEPSTNARSVPDWGSAAASDAALHGASSSRVGPAAHVAREASLSATSAGPLPCATASRQWHAAEPIAVNAGERGVHEACVAPDDGSAAHPDEGSESLLCVVRNAFEMAAAAAAVALLLVATVLRPGVSAAPEVVPFPQAAVAVAPPEEAVTVPAAAVEVPPVPAAPGPVHFTLTVESEPAAALVTLDGERLGRTPLRIEQTIGTGIGQLKIRRRGYKSRSYQIELREDLSLHVKLERVAASADDDRADDIAGAPPEAEEVPAPAASSSETPALMAPAAAEPEVSPGDETSDGVERPEV